ncbi:MAG: hypothetical protein ABJF04_25425 [Reichenbachiella sp.]|uniref:hypothetical protein n=1 Tax=Reichenbachiella sp. TaxID=2184521 RepID=UPI003263E339
MIRYLTIFCFILSTSYAEAGGGWTQGKKELYLKFGQQWVIFNQFYDKDGATITDRSRSFGTTSLYAEYGISDRLTGIVYFPFYSKSTLFEQKNSANGMVLHDGETFSSIGDTNIAIKYGLLTQSRIVVSASLTLGLPVGEVNKGTDGSLQTGDGEFNQMISLDFSSSIKVAGAYPYVSLNTGFNNRTEGFSDEFRYGFETGIGAGKWNIIFKVFGVKSFYNGSVDDNLFFEGLLSNNTEYTIVSPELAFKMSDKWGVSASMAKAISGQLMYVQPSYTMGVFFDLDI